MHGFLMVVATENKIDAHLRERAEYTVGVLETMAARKLPHYRIVMHDDDARITGARALELAARALELIATKVADDRDVAQVPGEGASRDALRRIEPDNRRAGNAQHRLEILVDEAAVVRQHREWVPEAERGLPPRDVMIAGNDDDLAEALRMLEEYARALELARPRALREVAGDGDDVEPALGDDRLDCLVLLRNGGMAEVEIRAVE